MKPILIVLVVIAVLAFGGLVIAGRDRTATDTANTVATPTPRVSSTSPTPNDDDQTMPTNDTGSNPESAADDQTASSAVTVTYGDNGFGEEQATVSAGGTLTVSNSSSRTIQINSDPHPQHTANSELNFGEIAPGASKQMTLNKTGTWGIHNHLDASETMQVIVK